MMVNPILSRRIGGLVASALAAALLVGCGGDDGPEPIAAPVATPAASPPAPPKGYRLVSVSEHGFAIALPKSWKTLPLDPALLKAYIKANQIEGLDPDKPLPVQFYALSPDGSGSNVNVTVASADGKSLEEFEKGYPEHLRSTPGKADVTARRMTLAGGEALRVTYNSRGNTPGGGTYPVHTVQYVLIRDGKAYFVTLGISGSKVTEADADGIGRTLYVL